MGGEGGPRGRGKKQAREGGDVINRQRFDQIRHLRNLRSEVRAGEERGRSRRP